MTTAKNNFRAYIVLLIIMPFISACEKFVEIDQIDTQLLAEQIFENEATANSAIAGIYGNLRTNIPMQASVRLPMYADEVAPFLNSGSNTIFTNNLLPTDTTLPWGGFYSTIYASNTAIEKLEASSSTAVLNKKQYIAEAKFVRAVAYFYLVNHFGDVPLILTTDLKTNSNMPRTAIATVYAQIIQDLKDAKADLGDDYGHAGNEKVRANKWVASAMLARVYLYQKDFVNAEIEANNVIGSGKYTLLSSPNGILNKNNSEAILQFANNSTQNNNETASFIYTTAPLNVLSTSLLNAFEPGDLRRTTWVRTQSYSGQPVSIPFKMTSSAVNPPEYHTLIRLAELYLIRAEAKAMRNDFQGSIDDLNLIRLRHGGLTTAISAATDQTTAINIILHERQVEFFVEGGHRFFDLKRTGKINSVMSAAKPTYWKSTAALYPIPSTELQRNPNMIPNPGYD